MEKIHPFSGEWCRKIRVHRRKHGLRRFDYRLTHRGRSNTSSKARPLLYLTYAREWRATGRTRGVY